MAAKLVRRHVRATYRCIARREVIDPEKARLRTRHDDRGGKEGLDDSTDISAYTRTRASRPRSRIKTASISISSGRPSWGTSRYGGEGGARKRHDVGEDETRNTAASAVVFTAANSPPLSRLSFFFFPPSQTPMIASDARPWCHHNRARKIVCPQVARLPTPPPRAKLNTPVPACSGMFGY